MITFERSQLVNEIITQPLFTGLSLFQKLLQMIAIDSIKQQDFGADHKEIQQINFTGNLDDQETKKYFSLFEKQKKAFQIYHKELRKYCNFVSF